MSQFRIGNVIRAPGDSGLWIVYDVNDQTIRAVSFTHENVSATQRLEDSTRRQRCSACYDQRSSVGCETCNGTGEVEIAIKGWNRAKVVATSAQAFIMNGVRRQFQL